MRKSTLALLLLGGVFLLSSCEADNDDNNASIFLGIWKTSYGDTILFTHKNGRYMVRLNESLNPVTPMVREHEYRYIDGKFSLNRTPGAGTDYFWQLDSFKWLEHGRSFQVQGIQWFMFLSATQTYFTFTRIL